jgi:hypothetical protein
LYDRLPDLVIVVVVEAREKPDEAPVVLTYSSIFQSDPVSVTVYGTASEPLPDQVAIVVAVPTGAFWSRTTLADDEAAPVLPALFVAVAVILLEPTLSATLVVILQAPRLSDEPAPIRVAPAYSRTVMLASAVPVKVKPEARLVTPSEVDCPESPDAESTGTEGAAGATV